jgi:hypothetical protein
MSTPSIFEHLDALGTCTFNIDCPDGQLRPFRVA